MRLAATGLFVAGRGNAALLCRVTTSGAQFRRHLLPWDRPLLAQAVAWLAREWNGRGALDLSSLLVVVPTRQSGRRLREALAEHAAARGSAVFAPRVVLPEDLLVPENDPRERQVASRLEAQLAWARVLSRIDLDDFRAVFPLDPPDRNFSWASRLGAQLQRLQATLAENGLRLGDVVRRAGEGLPEVERWRQLAALEQRLDAELAATGRLQLQVASIRLAHQPRRPAGVDRIVVLATPDPRMLSVEVLEALARELPVDVVVFGPADGLDLFDAWGRPKEEVWSRRRLELDFSSQVHLCADAAEQASRVATLASAYGEPEGLLAVGVADADVAPVLENRLRTAGLKLFNPGGHPRRREGFYALLVALAGLAAEPAFATVQALARCPDFADWLAGRCSHSLATVLRELDALHTLHLPTTLTAALAHTARRPAARAALDAAQELRDELTQGQFPDNASAVLEKIFGARRVGDDSLLAETAGAWTEILREVAVAKSDFPELDSRDWWELALAQLAESVHVDPREPGAVELLGWLELLWENAPHLVLAGFNDGRVPEAVTGDAFLPEALRARLGLKTNDTRFARDAYLLAALTASRRGEAGRLDVLVGKVSAAGDPVRPSRLLLLCDDAELPARVKFLFGPADSARSALPWARAWQLQPPHLAPPARVSVTAFRDYLRCPFRFYLKHVVRMETVDPLKSELDALDFGTLCHAALEAMGRETVLRDCRDPALLREFLVRHVDQRARERFGAELTLPLIVQLESARQRLSRAAEIQAAERAAGWVIERVEEKFELVLGAVTVSAKIDRIERHVATGQWRVIDYKTSDRGVTPLDAHVRSARKEETAPEWARFTIDGKELVWVDLQLPLYLEALAAELGRDVAAGYFNLPKAVGETVVSLWENHDERWREAARRCAEGVATAIAAGTFWPPAEIAERDEDDALAGLFHHGTAASVAWEVAR